MFFVILIIILLAVAWLLMPAPVRWLIRIVLSLLFVLWIILGIVKMRNRFGFFGTLKLILRVIIWLALITLVMILPSMIVRFIFIWLS